MKQAIDEGFILGCANQKDRCSGKLSGVVLINGAVRVASPHNTQRDSSCEERLVLSIVARKATSKPAF
jgi:hypothetical protein